MYCALIYNMGKECCGWICYVVLRVIIKEYVLLFESIYSVIRLIINLDITYYLSTNDGVDSRVYLLMVRDLCFVIEKKLWGPNVKART